MKKIIVLSGFMLVTLTLLMPFVQAEDIQAEGDAAQEAVAAAVGSAEAVQMDAPAADPVISPESAVEAVKGEVADAVKAPVDKFKSAVEAVTDNAAWQAYAPDIAVSKWGSEIKIVFTPNAKMKEDARLAIQSVKLESEAGEFLGLKTYGVEEKDRVAEFMVNPEILKIETAKITVASSKDGNYVKVFSVKPEEKAAEVSAPAIEAEGTAQPAAEVAAEANKSADAPREKPKKKGWPW